ncbi:MGMT family protein [Algoriphagus sp. A40]|uniref:MGMT family protein n=1 Tax=Algoriphagus sp. A40 TaxID=1945863 RepID=UPI0009848411|nr:MGMT family protein [Algoriphagus sp. A40]OOG69597.1 cysteine methyltransferase [Algoriphagus sp. A40]
MSNEKPNYFDLVYQVVREIPKGRVTSYGTIAHYLGLKSGARMVGYAMNAAHSMSDVPAQRVVNRNGLLTGKNHFESPTRMQELLKADGVNVENDRVVDFEKVFWDPEKELGL